MSPRITIVRHIERIIHDDINPRLQGVARRVPSRGDTFGVVYRALIKRVSANFTRIRLASLASADVTENLALVMLRGPGVRDSPDKLVIVFSMAVSSEFFVTSPLTRNCLGQQ